MDMDTTIKGLPVNEKTIRKIIDEILEIEDTTASMPPTHVGEKTEMEYPQDMDITKQIISGITRLRIPSIMIRRYLRIN